MTLFNGKSARIPSKQEIKELKKQKRSRERLWKKQVQEEEAAEQKEQTKADKQSGRDKYISTQSLQQSSTQLLKQVMAEQRISVKGNDIFNAVLKAQLGKKFARETRVDRHRILAIACAVYHQLALKPNPKKALHKLAGSVGVNIDRISGPCRIIIDCLVDYGASKKERLANRQYAARDARALRYIVRTGMSLDDVMNPAKGESISVWADREAEYRSGKRAAAKPAKKAPDKEVLPEPLTRPACNPFPRPARLQRD
jgi:hypothetical protein